ncbi:lycopene cyclase domain-containing protein [Kocuria sp. cx-455]|uniref:lycopene cyclase domain-containing protein n=1 Tax=Kocuria sp. cx-455 TaxID=2771377 RepID=UPI0016876CBE|nr:lycopene cyclase domain-containing protein [Kocuria sp. cx-455]MBD2766131.1 lycopene cyclase domain-containing protein [Kocuria sp. cx-455]
MTYWDVNFIFLGFAALVLVVAVLLRRPGPLFWGALGASTVLLFVLTAVFDNLMIAVGIMTYTDQNISGVQVGLAPLEDFAYPLAGVLLLPALWLLLGGRVASGRVPGGISDDREPGARTGGRTAHDNPRETRD